MSMLHTGSPFFDRFSLREFIEKNYPWAATRLSGVGGSIGGGSGYIGSSKSSYHKSETFSCQIHTTGDDRFDEPKFIESFRSLIQTEIIESKATISAQGTPEPGAFYFEYSFEDIRGRVDVVGKLVIANYVLTAEISERGEGIAHPTEGRWPIQPQGEYYVVGITEKPSARQIAGFLEIGRRLISESLESIRHPLSTLRPENLQYAEVFSLFRLPPEIRRAVEEQQIKLHLELNPDPWEEYEKYEGVYFLNETAVRMYRDAGIELDVLKTISAAEMPKQCHRPLRGPYVSKE
ncbi:MAG TPA: hypothetical protein VLM38_10530 [Blastocatellia bacterium]|nr:hypothetical protein [Blastocatellia bacterium]